LLCGDFLLPNSAPYLENRMTVCMGYPAMTPKRESRKTPPEGGRKSMQGERRTQCQLVKMAVDVVNDTKRHSLEEHSALRLTSCGHFDHMRQIGRSLNQCRQFVHIDSVRVTFDLDLTFCRVSPNFCNMVTLWWVTKTVTHHLEVVNGQNVHLPPSHNRECLVGGHFDHQPDNRNALLCKSGCYHFDNSHASVTLLVNNVFHYPPHTRNS